MMDCKQSKDVLCHTPQNAVAKGADGEVRTEKDTRIRVLREKIKDNHYLENALKKIASDLAREFY